MSVHLIIKDLDTWPKPVVEIPDISAAIIRRGFVDDIKFVPFNEDARDLLGMLVRWTHKHVYGTETEHVAVCYNENVDPWLQRLICCKEMVHIFEMGDQATNSRQAVSALLDGLFPNGSGMVLADVFRRQTLRDSLAVYQATSLMFPQAHRDGLEKRVAQGGLSLSEVAAELDVPVFWAETLFSEEWKKGIAVTSSMFG
jgi:hypothetical protein